MNSRRAILLKRDWSRSENNRSLLMFNTREDEVHKDGFAMHLIKIGEIQQLVTKDET
jgi:hypothetical protein